jgi:hypothetical protein
MRHELVGQPTVWQASINTRSVGDYPERDLAMQRVEECIAWDMKIVLCDWEQYQAQKKRARRWTTRKKESESGTVSFHTA